ncbi:5-oxoprolinase subunit PxpA [Ammonicoccus fulvus]|uniref:5-oxoprolinase subunit A n=1 Tax=Ammonicoccus fulvus TaxID=3138240 RepID=A0ABZ3FWN7_9ACTN
MRIDLNADLGESFGAWRMGDDVAMLDLVTSANIACGFHAGDALTMRRAVAAAAERGVSIGAHVSYPDLRGFGRRFLDVSPDELTADVLYQLGALSAMAGAAGTSVRYVKPHGALYNAIVHHEAQAGAVLDAIAAFEPGLPILALPGSAVLRLASERGLTGVAEAFADRAYHANGTLVSRRDPGAVLHDPDLIARRMVHLVTEGEIASVDGTPVRIDAASICVHGDSPDALHIARRVGEALTAAQVGLEAFA